MSEQQDDGSMKCEECGAVFETRQQLEGHQRSAHNMEEGMESGSEKGMQSDVQEGMEPGGQMTP